MHYYRRHSSFSSSNITHRYLNNCIAYRSSFWHFQVTASARGSQSTITYLTIMSSWLSSSDSFTCLWEAVAEQRSLFMKFIDSSNPSKKTSIHMQLNHSLNGEKQHDAPLANAAATSAEGNAPVPRLPAPRWPETRTGLRTSVKAENTHSVDFRGTSGTSRLIGNKNSWSSSPCHPWFYLWQ